MSGHNTLIISCVSNMLPSLFFFFFYDNYYFVAYWKEGMLFEDDWYQSDWRILGRKTVSGKWRELYYKKLHKISTFCFKGKVR